MTSAICYHIFDISPHLYR